MLRTLMDWFRGEELSCHDPVFGVLTTDRIRGRGKPAGDPPMFEWFASPVHSSPLRFSHVEEVVVHAGQDGPTEEQRRIWLDFLTRYPALEQALMSEIYSNYLWHRQRLVEECQIEFGDEDLSRYASWPVYTTPAEAFASPCFDTCSLDVYPDHVLIRTSVDWDEEHGLKIWVREGGALDVASE